jgi:hypothetical protein
MAMHTNIEITRVLAPDENIDVVFGIDTPGIKLLNEQSKVELPHHLLIQLTTGKIGYLVHRFFTDFVLAMKHASDTAFYCFRSLESLRQHCALLNGLQPVTENKSVQWELFRTLAGVSRDEIDPVREAGKGVRHGSYEPVTWTEREKVFTLTWSIAEKYFSALTSRFQEELERTYSDSEAEAMQPSPAGLGS